MEVLNPAVALHRLELAGQNHLERQRPGIRGKKWQAFALAACLSFCRVSPGQQQAPVASREEFGGFVWGSDGDVVRIGPEGPLIKL